MTLKDAAYVDTCLHVLFGLKTGIQNDSSSMLRDGWIYMSLKQKIMCVFFFCFFVCVFLFNEIYIYIYTRHYRGVAVFFSCFPQKKTSKHHTAIPTAMAWPFQTNRGLNATMSSLEKGGQWQQAGNLFVDGRGWGPLLVVNAVITLINSPYKWVAGVLNPYKWSYNLHSTL